MREFPAVACLFTLTSCLALGACGGGGGGGGTLPRMAPTTGFVPAAGAITLLPSFPSNALGSTLLPGSTAANFIVQSATTPGEPKTGGALTEYATTETESGGLSTSAVMRSAQSARFGNHYSDPDTRFDVPRTRFAAIERKIGRLQRVRASRAIVRTQVRPAFLTGETHDFYIQSGTITGGPGGSNDCPGYSACKKITAVLEAQSAHANVWVDQHSLADRNQFPSGTPDFTKLASNFDGYYSVETGIFGPATTSNPISFNQCKPDGSPATTQQPLVDLSSGVINLVVTDALANSGEGGYFFVIDLLNQQEVNCIGGTVPKTNALPMFVMGSDYYPNSPPTYSTYNEPFWNGSDAPRTASHELQHFIHALSKVFQHNVGDDAWVDEGCSMLAEDLAADGMHIDTPRFSYTYLLEPGDFSLTSFTGYQPDPLSKNPNPPPYSFYHNTAGSYGMSYLFFRYLYDRFGQNAITNIVQSSQSGAGNVSAVTSEPFPQLYLEWATAVAAQSTGTTNDPRFSFKPAVILRGTVTVTSRRPGGVRPLTFAGPQKPEDFANNPPTSFLPTLAPGVTETPKLIDGATLFFEATPTSGGDTVRASTTSSAAAFQASLVQGKYTQGTPFTPNP